MTSKFTTYPVWKDEKLLCRTFLEQYQGLSDDINDSAPELPKYLYMRQLQNIVDRKADVLEIKMDDIKTFFDGNAETVDFTERILCNTLRYVKLFYRSADRLIKELQPSSDAEIKVDAQDVYLRQRMNKFRALNGGADMPDYDSDDDRPEAIEARKQMLPAELLRRYEIHLTPLSSTKYSSMRQIRAGEIGSLVSLRGIITRVTDVAPLIRVVTYICTVCGFESYQSVNDRQFNPLKVCPSPVCQTNQSKGHLLIQNRASKYVKYEAVKLQELPSEVPVGHIPRSIDLRLYGSWTRKCKPGDAVSVSGIFLPTPHIGRRGIRAGLMADTFIEVTNLVAAKVQYSEIQLTPALISEFEQLAAQPDVFDQLAGSIAPEIFGHSDIKKALLLLLIAGVTKNLSDGVKIRGDLNILLMGDPGVAKSQLLKQVAVIAPRGVYTTGKGSSGVGLTAAVVRDQVTGSMTLEGGSLVLADKGVCCIDEFDKMEEADRTAIHEVMEQQTVSIAKAGITTTLNARTAVVAAANPVFGRFNPGKSIETNLGLPTSLLSRFDLQFIILDTPDRDLDENLASHVTFVHRFGHQPPTQHSPKDAKWLRAYISHARSFEPVVPPELQEDIVSHYTALRTEDEHEAQQDSRSSLANQRQRFVTPRSLLSILRLAQAHARLHLRNEVSAADIGAAIALMNASKNSLTKDNNGTSAAEAARRDPMSAIYSRIIQEFRARRVTALDRAEMRRLVLTQGFNETEYERCLNEYERLNVWTMTSRQIHLIETSSVAGGEEMEEE